LKSFDIHYERLSESYDDVDRVAKAGAGSSSFRTWHRRVSQSLNTVFGTRHVYAESFSALNFSFEGSVDVAEYRNALQRAFVHDLRIAQDIISDALQELAEETVSHQEGSVLDGVQVDGTEVFLVHGHDTSSREAVARFLERGGLQVTILHEQPDRGRTIIEKFEAHAQPTVAVVLLSPDDPPSDARLPGRPRQNVLLELGFFLGVLGRGRVIAMLCPNTEMPSDYSGVLYIPYHESGDWKQRLARELGAAGLQFNVAKALA
jgi:hypothetical protein